MGKTGFLRSLVTAGWLVMPVSAFAAPFCMNIPGTASQCIYVDGAQCARDAARQNGSCDVNPREVRPSARVAISGNYCVVTPEGGSRCGYADGENCGRDALIQHGVCTKAVGTGPKQRPDQYNINANR